MPKNPIVDDWIYRLLRYNLLGDGQGRDVIIDAILAELEQQIPVGSSAEYIFSFEIDRVKPRAKGLILKYGFSAGGMKGKFQPISQLQPIWYNLQELEYQTPDGMINCDTLYRRINDALKGTISYRYFQPGLPATSDLADDDDEADDDTP